MFLIPGTSHIITWAKQNLLDTATYYVRAVVRDVRTNTTLQTINLTDLGSSNRFSGTWLVVEDSSGQGREISIIKTVYEDSGYTIVSGIYGAWEDRYTIYALNRATNTGGMSSGTNTIDYSLIGQMIERAVKKSAPEKIDLSELINAVTDTKQTLGERIKSIFTSKQSDSLSELKSSLEACIYELQDDIADIRNSISETKQDKSILTTIKQYVDDIKSLLGDQQDSFNNKIEEIGSNYQDTLDKLEKVVSNSEKQSEDFGKTVTKILKKPVRVQLYRNFDGVRADEPLDDPLQDEEEKEATNKINQEKLATEQIKAKREVVIKNLSR